MIIANKGSTKTKIYNNNEYKTNDIKWDAKYDGKVADINLDVNNNGKKKHLHMNLTNDELAQLLNIPSVGLDLQKRLKSDFKYDVRTPRFIELENDEITTNINPNINPSVDLDIYIPKYSTRSNKKFSVKRRNRKNTPRTMRLYI
jgi:hypothetical protein